MQRQSYFSLEVVNTVSVETTLSSGVFQAFQCVAMQTAFLAQQGVKINEQWLIIIHLATTMTRCVQ